MVQTVKPRTAHLALSNIGLLCLLCIIALVVLMPDFALSQQTALQPIESFPLKQDGITIWRRVEAGNPFTVAGERGVLVGQQEGTFEAWLLPVKLLSHFTIEANVEGYTVPIDVNSAAAEIEVRPDHTTITYSHIAFTIRQIMFAPAAAEDGTGAVVLFQFDATAPMDLVFRFTPEILPMWPQPSLGTPSGEWIPHGNSGLYILHTDFSNMAGAVAIPGAASGILEQFQEKPAVHPLEFKLHYDPKRDKDKYFPLLMAAGETEEAASTAALEAKLSRLDANLPKIYAEHAAHYADMASQLTSIHTPDTSFDAAFSWAETSIEQLKAKAHPSGETGLVAGYFSSGDSARPGFGWYFGRDTLYTLYAVNRFGDFALTRNALEFLIARQRDDGKIMHEYSQTAEFVKWRELPYMYAAADSTPLFLTAMLDYVRSSGDIAFLQKHKDAIRKAWQFETTHDTDGDGILDNSQGTGWVEGWTATMPHQEIYLAALDQQASAAMGKLAELLGDSETSAIARKRGEEIAQKLESEYYNSTRDAYAFSRNMDKTRDDTATIYPAIAWWNGGYGLAHSDATFKRWASHDFSTDWGTRDIAESDPAYDPISYHRGSVWPLFTGWVATAEYQSGHVMSGYAHLMQNADQTTNQDLGAVTELLSGAYFQPFGRSTSHQLWSSAMVVIPAMKGLFGIESDALDHVVRLNPHLPADWREAHVDSLHVGDSLCSLEYRKQGQSLIVRVKTGQGPPVHLTSTLKSARISPNGEEVRFELPEVEVAIGHGLPLPGARTQQLKVLSETSGSHSLKLELEANAGTISELKLCRNVEPSRHPLPPIQAEGARITPAAVAGDCDSMLVTFSTGAGYKQQAVTLRW